MTEKTDSRPTPLDELAQAQRRWWRRYSPHGELPWSSSVSLMCHVFVVLLIIVATTAVLRRDPPPPAVDVIYVGEEETAAAGIGDLLGSSVPLKGTEEDSFSEVPQERPPEELDKAQQPDLRPPDFEPPLPSGDVTASVATAEMLQDLADRANEHFGKQGAAAGTETGNAAAEGGGAAGPGLTGRAARVARWELHFDTRSPQHYLKQLDGLGATIAFPLPGDKWQYFYNPSSSRRTSEIRELTGENRLYWMDDKLTSFPGVAETLGVPTAPFMVVFLPRKLEEKMLKLELTYNNLEEHEIRSTHFKAVPRGGKMDVVVIRQIAK